MLFLKASRWTQMDRRCRFDLGVPITTHYAWAHTRIRRPTIQPAICVNLRSSAASFICVLPAASLRPQMLPFDPLRAP